MEHDRQNQARYFTQVGFWTGGCASVAFSRLMNHKVAMAVTDVSIMNSHELVERLSETDGVWVGSYIQVTGGVQGYVEMMLSRADAIKLSNKLVYGSANISLTMNENALSAIKEAANIVSSSFVKALSESTHMEYFESVPRILVDEPHGIVQGPLREVLAHEKGESLWVTTCVELNSGIESYLVIVLTQKSFDQLTDVLKRMSTHEP